MWIDSRYNYVNSLFEIIFCSGWMDWWQSKWSLRRSCWKVWSLLLVHWKVFIRIWWPDFTLFLSRERNQGLYHPRNKILSDKENIRHFYCYGLHSCHVNHFVLFVGKYALNILLFLTKRNIINQVLCNCSLLFILLITIKI